MHRETVLIGHSLNNDLHCLRLVHPYIVDSAMLFPLGRGPPALPSLKDLAWKHLHRRVQETKGGTASGHDPKEDAVAALDLVKCAYRKTGGKPWLGPFYCCDTQGGKAKLSRRSSWWYNDHVRAPP